MARSPILRFTWVRKCSTSRAKSVSPPTFFSTQRILSGSCSQLATNPKSPEVPVPTNRGPKDTYPIPALITRNNFIFKSLSDWSFNIAHGCLHGCTFCYVPNTSEIKQSGRIQAAGYVPPEWIEESESTGIPWADARWGEYALLRAWDEKAFLNSLRKAEGLKPPPQSALRRWQSGKLTSKEIKKEKAKYLSPDGNRAVMFSTTTDPYQTFSIRGDLEKTKLLNALRERLVTRSLELILEESTLNVRILTRSPLARKDFALFKKFGDRLLFGMSLPTLDPKLAKIYEPHAPGPAQKLKVLREAKEAGLNIFIAMAPTLPDQGHAEITQTMKAIVELQPITIFHEPINLRADNLARIEAKARKENQSIRSEVFHTRERWRRYALGQLQLVEQVARELKIPQGVLHLWPDTVLASEAQFIEMRRAQNEEQTGVKSLSGVIRAKIKDQWNESMKPWLDYWHNPKERLSSWPGKRIPQW